MNKPPRLENLPVSIFAIVMGIAGFSLSLRNIKDINIYFADAHLYVAFFALAVFAILLILYFIKAFKYPDKITAEMNNNMTSGFFAAVPISIILLSTCFQFYVPDITQITWLIGAILQLVITYTTVNKWLYDDVLTTEHITPVWFLPVVGNLVVPIAGIEFVPVEINWMFFSIGFFFWFLVFTLVMFRLMFDSPLPLMISPSVFILLAPPAVGFLAWTTINPDLDSLSHILYYVAVFFFLMLIVRLPKIMRIKFNISFWALSFPLAAMSMATFKMHSLSGVAFLEKFAWGLEALTSIIVIWLLLRTIWAIKNRELCLVPPKG